MTFSPQDFAKATGVSRETLARLSLYADLLLRWQKRINLIAPATVPALWHRHMLDSAQLVPLIPKTAQHLADLGSGAGFPGVVVALCLDPPCKVDLYESDRRKSAFLQAVVRHTGAPARVITQRIEDMLAPQADLLMARALAPLPKLLSYAERFWRPGVTALFMKGRGLDKEIESCSGLWRFAYDRIPSITDSAASILHVRSLSRV